jgi:hypothetical protein
MWTLKYDPFELAKVDALCVSLERQQAYLYRILKILGKTEIENYPTVEQMLHSKSSYVQRM